MREIKYIVAHCTATPLNTTIQSILNYWRAPKPRGNGWKDPGYHYIITPAGLVVNLQPIEKIANGVAGFNSVSIHVATIGGIDAKGRALDNRTDEQKLAQIDLFRDLKAKFPKAIIQGHRDFPGVTKSCPSYDTAEWLKCVGLQN